ncbi:MAG: HD domain-containing phosphohydrolase [Acidobacteriota bacterium]
MADVMMIVGDNPLNAQMLEELVRRLGDVTAVAFATSAEGIEYCAQQEPDLVIIDNLTLEPESLKIVSRFKGFPSRAEIPVIVVTSTDERELRYRAFQLGANDFLAKPIDPVEFIARALNMLLLRRSQLQLAERAEWLTGEVKKAVAEIAARERETIVRLSRAAGCKDCANSSHLMRIAEYSRHIARNMGMPEEEQELLSDAALMHDLGKVAIPDSVLLKPGPLTEDEQEVMWQHTVFGHSMLKDSDSMVLRAAAEIALCHHEKLDGSGYPNGLKGDAIPIRARIVAVADAFDAQVSPRPYQHPLKPESALEVLRRLAQTQLDPECVRALAENWQEVLDIHDRLSDDSSSSGRDPR